VTSTTTTITSKGQVTIPVEIRRALDLKAGDRIAVEQQGETVLLHRAMSVAERTAGVLAAYRRPTPLSVDEERAAFEAAVAEEVVGALEP
jgi:AbrB family looped-hinge helix DNA binding protein